MFTLPFNFISKIPQFAWGLVFLLVGFLAVLYWGHYKYKEGQSDLLTQQTEQVQKLKIEEQKITSNVEVKFSQDRARVQQFVVTLEKKVPIYVTKENDSNCTVNRGFVRLWNSANQMSVPSAPSSTDAAGSSVVLSDIAAQHGREAGICLATERQLSSLKDWVRQQQLLHR